MKKKTMSLNRFVLIDCYLF